jgi:hypothetical protein
MMVVMEETMVEAPIQEPKTEVINMETTINVIKNTVQITTFNKEDIMMMMVVLAITTVAVLIPNMMITVEDMVIAIPVQIENTVQVLITALDTYHIKNKGDTTIMEDLITIEMTVVRIIIIMPEITEDQTKIITIMMMMMKN